jgi:heme exporter protein A
LRLGSGEIAEVTGPNGVGKSTLLRAIAGFLPLGSGRISWVESEATDSALLAERLHYVGHLDGLKSALTARENLNIGRGLLGRGRLTPLEALGRMELAHVLDLPVGYLSAGQRRRVALARLLITDRPLWLLDEPLTALDRHARALLKAVVADHLGSGGLVIAATHEQLGLPGTIQVRLEAR